MLVLDTSALLYWTLADAKLSTNAAEAIRQDLEIMISSISIWEIGLKVKRARMSLPLSFPAYVDRLKEVDKVQVLPVTETTWLKNLELDWDHKDPADRTIVATAIMLGCPLVTSDARVRSFYGAAIW